MIPSFESIILSRPDRIGDIVVSTACLASLKERFPEARFYMLINEVLMPLLEGHSLLDGLVGLTFASEDVSRARLNALFLSSGKSLLIELNSHPWVTRVAASYSNVTCRRYKRGWLDFSGTARDRRGAGRVHEAFAAWRLFEGLGVSEPFSLSADMPSYEDVWPPFVVGHQELDSFPFAVFHLSAYGGKRSWPLPSFVRVASILAESRGWRPVLVGADGVLCDAFVACYKGVYPVINLSGKTSLRELGALLSRAQLTLSRDSGPAHLAAAVGCPTVALMTSHPKHCARRWAPLGARVAVVEQPLLRKKWFEPRDVWWERVFASIAIDDVLDAINRVAPLAL